MKFNSNDAPTKFAPFSVSFTFENEEEAKAFHNIINHAFITEEAFGNYDPPAFEAARNHIVNKLGTKTMGFEEFNKRIAKRFKLYA